LASFDPEEKFTRHRSDATDEKRRGVVGGVNDVLERSRSIRASRIVVLAKAGT
jgi:hypothetical protein